MVWENERCTTDRFLPIWVRHEHLARYDFAALYVSDRVVVDCACGDGTGSIRFAQAGAAQVFAFDASADAIQHATQRLQHEKLRFQQADASKLPFPDHTADVFISLETIEHLQADDAFLREVARVVKPDGLFICSTPNRSVCNPGKTLHCKPVNPFHVREYNHQELAQLLSAHFRTIQWFGQNPKARALTRLLDWLGRWLPAHGAVRLSQMFKLPRFLYDRISHHQVLPAANPELYEYFVAACQGPYSTHANNKPPSERVGTTEPLR